MGVEERLSLEAARAETMIAGEHRQRYRLATALCRDLRVLDLCCGSGYGTRMLAERARDVVGVDVDVATVDLAARTVGADRENVAFEAADAVDFLATDIPQRFDLVVCFEGLEHLERLDRALDLLAAHAARGTRLIVSLPNDRGLGVDNRFHVTSFGWHDVQREFERFGEYVVLPQFLAEGSLILPPNARELDVELVRAGRDEIEYANHFILAVNVDPEELARAHRGRMQLSAAPLFNRWAEDLKRGAAQLRRENTRLALTPRARGAAAGVEALRALEAPESVQKAERERAERAERRVRELERTLAEMAVPSRASATLMRAPDAALILEPDEDAGADEDATPAGLGGFLTAVGVRPAAKVGILGGPEPELLAAVERLNAHAEALANHADQDAVRPGTLDALIVLPDPSDPAELVTRLRPALKDTGALVFRTRGHVDLAALEAALAGPLEAHLLASAYEPALLAIDPVQTGELARAQSLERRRPGLVPVLSRDRPWIAVSAQAQSRRPPLLRPWITESVESRDVEVTRERTVHLLGGSSLLTLSLPSPTDRLVLTVRRPEFRTGLELRADDHPQWATARLVGRSAHALAVEFRLPRPAARLALSASAPCEITFAAYAA